MSAGSRSRPARNHVDQPTESAATEPGQHPHGDPAGATGRPGTPARGGQPDDGEQQLGREHGQARRPVRRQDPGRHGEQGRRRAGRAARSGRPAGSRWAAAAGRRRGGVRAGGRSSPGRRRGRRGSPRRPRRRPPGRPRRGRRRPPRCGGPARPSARRRAAPAARGGADAATASRRCSPPDRWRGSARSRWPGPGWPGGRGHARCRPRRPSPRAREVASTSSSTVPATIVELDHCGTHAIVRARSRASRSAGRCPGSAVGTGARRSVASGARCAR